MQKVHKRILVANEMSCRNGDAEMAVVHACKSPCHQQAVGYKGSLSKDHPNYLCLRHENDLFLNIIDPPVPLFPNELFSTFLPFAREMWDSGKTLLIHCNQGESRAPSLALIFLAKHLRSVSNDSYASARSDFIKIFPRYLPGRGIEKYLTTNWDLLNDF